MSKSADEGTIAHALAALCLTENQDAAAYIGRIIECEDYEHSKLGPSGADKWMACPGSAVLESAQPFVERKFSGEVTEDMAEHVQTYVDDIRTYADGNRMLVEQSLDISHVLGGEQGGTGDVVIIADNATELQIHDLKFGRGVEVFAEQNKQLMLYALGALREYEMLGNFERVRLVIHQPRIKNAPDEWDCTVEELLDFAGAAKAAADLCNDLLEAQYIESCQPDAPVGLLAAGLNVLKPEHLVPGDKQCRFRFCDAKAICPALAAKVSKDVFDDFDVIGNPHETVEPQPVPAHAAKLGVYMGRLDLIEDWCRATRAKVFEELNAGVDVPGWKLVAGRRGSRAWQSKDEAEAALKAARLKREEMYTWNVISPTVAEKVLKKEKPRVWARLQALITQSDGKPHVAPASDPKPALSRTIDDFEDLTT